VFRCLLCGKVCTSAFGGKKKKGEKERRLGRSQGLSSELPMVLSSRLERQLPFSQSLGMVVDGRVDGGDG